MGDIVERILRSHEGGVSGNIRGKIRNYISLLASTGKTDEQLLQLGKAYLQEIQNPDPRYSGC